MFLDFHYDLKDLPTSIPKSDLLCVTMAVIHVAGPEREGLLVTRWLTKSSTYQP